jgi:hypothetical protein
MHHDSPFTVEDLEPYGHARVPESQQQAVERGKIIARRDRERNALCCSQTLKNGTLTHPSL